MPEQTTAAGPTAQAVVEALTRGRFSYRNELQLHDGIVIALNTAGIPVDASMREVRLSAG